MDRNSWGKSSHPPPQWNPTPPTTPPANAWSQQPSRREDYWNHSAYLNHQADTRGRNRANSWGNVRRDDWDSVPGWSSQGTNTRWGNTPLASPPASNNWAPAPQSTQNSWGAPPTMAPSLPNQSGWNPAPGGWLPLPPVKPAEPVQPPTPGWDGRRPATAGESVQPNGMPSAPSVNPAPPAAPERAVNFNTLPRPQGDGQRSNGRYPRRPSTSRANQSNNRQDDHQLTDRPRQERRDLRKAKSAFALADRPRMYNDEQLDDRRNPIGAYSQSPHARDEHERRGGRDQGRDRFGFKGNHKSNGNLKGPKTKVPTSQGPSDEAEDRTQTAEGRRGLAKASSRLFNRQMEEVNKSLGGTGAPRSPEETQEEKELKDTKPVQTQRRKRSSKQLKDAAKDSSKATGVYVYGFPKWVRVREMIDIFADYGAIVNVGIVARPKRYQRAYAYIDYETEGSAQKAVDALKEKKFFDMSVPLELRLHFEKADRTVFSQNTDNKNAAELVKAKGSEKDTKVDEKNKENQEKIKKSEKENMAETAQAKAAGLDLKTLHLGNIPLSTDKVELDTLFAKYGTVTRLHIINRPREKRAYAFVSFAQQASAASALAGIKDQKLFGMDNTIKVDYAREKDKKQSRKPVDKPWKMGEALETEKRNRGRRERGGRTAVVVRSIPSEMSVEDAVQKLKEMGDVKAHLVVKTSETASGQADATAADNTLLIVVFTSPDSAAKAVTTKVLNAAFPRQRRLHVSNLPATVTSEDLKKYFDGCGAVQRVDLPPIQKAGKTAVVEFVRGDGAAKGLIRCREVEMSEGVQVVGAYALRKAGDNAHKGEPQEQSLEKEVYDKENEEEEDDDNAEDDESSDSDEDDQVPSPVSPASADSINADPGASEEIVDLQPMIAAAEHATEVQTRAYEDETALKVESENTQDTDAQEDEAVESVLSHVPALDDPLMEQEAAQEVGLGESVENAETVADEKEPRAAEESQSNAVPAESRQDADVSANPAETQQPVTLETPQVAPAVKGEESQSDASTVAGEAPEVPVVPDLTTQEPVV